MSTKQISINICEDCLSLKGECCNNPDCVFIRQDMKEVSRILDMFLIRPIVDGVQVEWTEPDICGLCGQPGADKIAHPIHWPGESVSSTGYVHSECEEEECRRAHAALSEQQREQFLRTV